MCQQLGFASVSFLIQAKLSIFIYFYIYATYFTHQSSFIGNGLKPTNEYQAMSILATFLPFLGLC